MAWRRHSTSGSPAPRASRRMLEAPENSFRWKGGGLLSIDAQGISVAVKRGCLPARRQSHAAHSHGDLGQVFREGEALRVEFQRRTTARACCRSGRRSRRRGADRAAAADLARRWNSRKAQRWAATASIDVSPRFRPGAGADRGRDRRDFTRRPGLIPARAGRHRGAVSSREPIRAPSAPIAAATQRRGRPAARAALPGIRPCRDAPAEPPARVVRDGRAPGDGDIRRPWTEFHPDAGTRGSEAQPWRPHPTDRSTSVDRAAAVVPAEHVRHRSRRDADPARHAFIQPRAAATRVVRFRSDDLLAKQTTGIGSAPARSASSNSRCAWRAREALVGRDLPDPGRTGLRGSAARRSARDAAGLCERAARFPDVHSRRACACATSNPSRARSSMQALAVELNQRARRYID